MSTDRLAVYTTIHAGSVPFLGSWYGSVQRQTDRRFDLWISLDAVPPDTIDVGAIAALRYAGAPDGEPEPPVHWLSAIAGDTPASLRQRAFAQLATRYDAIVLVDADDVLDPARVASARQMLATFDVAGCALRLVDEQGVDLGVTFGPADDDDLPSMLTRCNVFGLSNSAYRASALARCLPVPAETVLIDWLLATRALISGATFGFDRVPRMDYRQYDRNTARVLPPFTAEAVLAAAALVTRHYRLLLESEWGWTWPREARQPFESARARAEAFAAAMQSSPALLDRYVTALNQLTPRIVWWWAVAHPDLEYLWSPQPPSPPDLPLMPHTPWTHLSA
jgi:hypothetical protein